LRSCRFCGLVFCMITILSIIGFALCYIVMGYYGLFGVYWIVAGACGILILSRLITGSWSSF
jgi:hypothetical protein